MFCCTLLYVHSSFAIILIGKKELVTLLNLSSWCLVMVERLFLAVPRGCLRFVIVVFLDHTHLLFYMFCGIESFGVLCVFGVFFLCVYLPRQSNRLYYKDSHNTSSQQQRTIANKLHQCKSLLNH